jgi:hypothetical protein
MSADLGLPSTVNEHPSASSADDPSATESQMTPKLDRSTLVPLVVGPDVGAPPPLSC